MTGLIPLLLVWLAANKASAATPATTVVTQPFWPTPASPPPPVPPMPAFETISPPMPATVVNPTADSGTPLSSLHQASKAPAKKKPKPTLKQRATSAAKNAALKAAKGSLNLSTAQQHTSSVSVLELQKILNARGAKLKGDGLYGPKTASAWQAAAKKKTLPPTISRVGPKIAKVVTKTYDTLKVPAIP